MKDPFAMIRDLAKKLSLAKTIPDFTKGFVQVNLWISQSNDVGHASIEVYRVNKEKNDTEHSYLGFWPNSDEELGKAFYPGNTTYFYHMLFGIKGRIADIALESLGAADFKTMWDKQNSSIAKRYGVLPTFTFKFVTLDVDAIFKEMEELKTNQKNKLLSRKYSPIASAGINVCNLLKVDNCLTIVEELLVKGGFKKLLYNNYDWFSPIFSVFGTVLQTCSNPLDYHKSLKYLAYYWIISRAVMGTISGARNALVSNTNPYIGGGFFSGFGLLCGGAITGAITYAFPYMPLARKGAYIIKTPENFLNELRYAQQVEFQKYPLLQTYNADCDQIISKWVPKTEYRTKYLINSYCYVVVCASLVNTSNKKVTNDKFDDLLRQYDNLDTQKLDQIENSIENDTINILNENKTKLQTKLADPTISKDTKDAINKNIVEIDKEISESQKRLKP